MNKFPRFIKANRDSNAHDYFQHEIAQTESFYGRWSRFCWQNSLSSAEASVMLAPFNDKANLLRPELGLPLGAWDRHVDGDALNGQRLVATALGMTYTELACATGEILGKRHLCKRSFALRLRWCPMCMAAGFHSVVFQHRALNSCPMHGIPLRQTCPSCLVEIVPSYRSVAHEPFGCDRCGEVWLSPGKRPGDSPDLPIVGAMLADRATELGITAEPQRVFVSRSTLGPVTPSAPAHAARSLARSCVWPLGRSFRWPSFPTSCAFLPDWRADGVQRSGSEERDAVRDCLRWLEHACARPDDARTLRHLHFNQDYPGPVLRPVSLASVALHRTAVQYGREVAVEPREPTASTPGDARVYDDVTWSGFQVTSPLFESPSGNALLLRSEVLTYFAITLLEALKLDFVGPRYWGTNTDSGRVSATEWVVEQQSGGQTLHWRPRATARLVTRLLRRYRNRTVEAWPDFHRIGSNRTMFDVSPGWNALHKAIYAKPSSMSCWQRSADRTGIKAVA